MASLLPTTWAAGQTITSAYLNQLDATVNGISNGAVSSVFVQDTGTVNTVVVAASQIPAYFQGLQLITVLANTNTSTSVTVNLNGLGALPVYTSGGAPPPIGYLLAGQVYQFIYSPSLNSGNGGFTVIWNAPILAPTFFGGITVNGQVSTTGYINGINLINPATVGGTVGPFSTVETLMTNGMLIAANSFANGQRFRITVNAYCTTTAVNTNALRVRVGPNNSTSDTQISLWNVITTAGGNSIAFKVVFEIQIFGSGASTPVACDGGAIINSSPIGVISSVAALSYNGFQSANINNTVPVYINATYQSAASTSSVLVATSLVEMVR